MKRLRGFFSNAVVVGERRIGGDDVERSDHIPLRLLRPAKGSCTACEHFLGADFWAVGTEGEKHVATYQISSEIRVRVRVKER